MADVIRIKLNDNLERKFHFLPHVNVVIVSVHLDFFINIEH